MPVNLDSRLQLLRVEHPTAREIEPIFSPGLKEQLTQLIGERKNADRLQKAGARADPKCIVCRTSRRWQNLFGPLACRTAE